MGPHVALDVEDFEETKRTLKELNIEFLEAPATWRAANYGSSIPTATRSSSAPPSDREIVWLSIYTRPFSSLPQRADKR